MARNTCQNRIRVVLADKQLTNRWLAEQMGVTEMTVSRISRLLQVDIKELLEVEF